MSTEQLDFETIVPAAQAGDKKAQDALMVGFYNWTIGQARLYGAEEEQARDIAVEFWGSLFANDVIAQYDASRGSFFGWMKLKLKAMAYAEIRKSFAEKRRPAHDPVPYDDERMHVTDEQSPEALVDAADLAEAMRDRLHGSERDVFDLMCEEYTAAEIAEHLGLTPGYTRTLIANVRRKLAAFR